ncbi:hypothetical protein ABI59_17400 [Acidobacteria bacterium Mor1]|nr:hypothetical protein ABI59_17400 [Acidobacteria bacterium Mor1]
MIRDVASMDRPVEHSPRKSWTKRLVLGGMLLAVLIAAVLLAPSFASWFQAERSFDRSLLRFATVERGDLQRELSVQGRVVAAFHPTTSSPAAGLVGLRVQAGDVVTRNQVLAVVDSPEATALLNQERSTLQSLAAELERERIQTKQENLSNRQAVDLARVELEAATRAMDRAERSRKEGIVNQVEYEEAQDNLRRSQLALRHAEQDAGLEAERLEFEIHNREIQIERQRMIVAEAGRRVDELEIRSPVDGLVSRLDVDDHDPVTPGQPLVAVVDLSAFEIEVMIPEAYADDVGPQTEAEVRNGSEIYNARIASISPEVESNQVRAVVTFADGVPDGLRQNQRLSVRLLLESRDSVLKVERGPFIDAGGGRYAYVISGDSAIRREIELGVSSVREVEVLGGLKEGDRIVVSDTARFQRAENIYLTR